MGILATLSRSTERNSCSEAGHRYASPLAVTGEARKENISCEPRA